jgi:Fe-S cluster assembly protein SufD
MNLYGREISRPNEMTTTTATDPKASVQHLLDGSHWTHSDEALELFQGLPIPGTKTEAWKYTRVARLFGEPFEVPRNDGLIALPERLPFSALRIVFLNGRFRKDLSDDILSADNRLRLDLAAMAAARNPKVAALPRTIGDVQDHFFTAMNAAKPTDGLFIHVEANYCPSIPIHILHIARDGHQLMQPRDIVWLDEGASLELIIEHIAINGKTSLLNCVREFVVGQDARLTVHKVQHEVNGPAHISQESVIVHGRGTFSMDTTTIEGDLVRNNVHVQLVGPEAHAELNGVYLLNGTTHCDNHTYIGHDVPDCTSDELYKGIIAEKGTGVFNGKVYVKQDAQRTRAYQSNANILQGDDARIFTKPELEIYADDVKCSHGCTIGRLDEKGLFYLRSRGVSEAEARRMLSHAFMTDALERITNEDWRQHLEGLINAKLETI